MNALRLLTVPLATAAATGCLAVLAGPAAANPLPPPPRVSVGSQFNDYCVVWRWDYDTVVYGACAPAGTLRELEVITVQ